MGDAVVKHRRHGVSGRRDERGVSARILRSMPVQPVILTSENADKASTTWHTSLGIACCIRFRRQPTVAREREKPICLSRTWANLSTVEGLPREFFDGLVRDSLPLRLEVSLEVLRRSESRQHFRSDVALGQNDRKHSSNIRGSRSPATSPPYTSENAANDTFGPTAAHIHTFTHPTPAELVLPLSPRASVVSASKNETENRKLRQHAYDPQQLKKNTLQVQKCEGNCSHLDPSQHFLVREAVQRSRQSSDSRGV